MGKRKQKTPVRAAEDKRQCLAWNMKDGWNSNSGIASDQGPSVECSIPELTIQVGSDQPSASNKTPKGLMTSQTKSQRATYQEMFDDYLSKCPHRITIQRHLASKHSPSAVVLATFPISLLSTGGRDPPLCLPPGGDEFWLYGSTVEMQSMIYIETGGDNLSQCSTDFVFWNINMDVPLNVS